MRRTIPVIVLLALMLAALAAPVGAAKPAGNPNELCAENIFMEMTPEGPFPLEIPSHGGCVSSWATGQVSNAAYVSQCKLLEDSLFDYPYAFYGRVDDPRYVAENRADCTHILRLFHTGQLEPGPAS